MTGNRSEIEPSRDCTASFVHEPHRSIIKAWRRSRWTLRTVTSTRAPKRSERRAENERAESADDQAPLSRVASRSPTGSEASGSFPGRGGGSQPPEKPPNDRPDESVGPPKRAAWQRPSRPRFPVPRSFFRSGTRPGALGEGCRLDSEVRGRGPHPGGRGCTGDFAAAGFGVESNSPIPGAANAGSASFSGTTQTQMVTPTRALSLL